LQQPLQPLRFLDADEAREAGLVSPISISSFHTSSSFSLALQLFLQELRRRFGNSQISDNGCETRFPDFIRGVGFS
jgi:hypothetical protein